MNLDEGFWALVAWAAGIATALATGVSTVVAMWWRRTDKRRADFLVFDAGANWRSADPYSNQDSPPEAAGRVANVGDGTAYQLVFTGVGCLALVESIQTKTDGPIAWREQFPLVPVADPGWAARIVIFCEPDEWDAAYVVLTWTESPTWRGLKSRRTQWLRLSAIAPRPRYGTTEYKEHASVFVEQNEPARPVLPDSLRTEYPLPHNGRLSWLEMRRIDRRFRRSAQAGRPDIKAQGAGS